MIVSFILAVALFAAAAFGWGVIFYSEGTGLSRRVKLLMFFFLTASAVFSSIFFLRGLADAVTEIDPAVSSLAFALAFLVSLLLGYLLAPSRQLAAAFRILDELGSEKAQDKDRSGVVDGILERIEQAGELDSLEKELIGSILKFKDKIVREVMIPRADIVAINIEEDPRRVLRRVAEEGYSRMPVYNGSIDNIVGVIYAKDLITMAEGSGAIVLQDILRSPYYVPESKKISQLLREMQRNKVHLAIVVDEFGGTEGIITLEDVLEEIVGEIQDEYDESLSELTRDENGDIHIAGSMTVDRFNELLETDIPLEEDYDTVAGFVQKLAGKLPQKGEVYNHGEMFFIVEELARHRIKRVKVSFKEHPSLAEVSRLPVESSELSAPLPGEPTHASVAAQSAARPSPGKKATARKRTGKKAGSDKKRATSAGAGRGTRKKK